MFTLHSVTHTYAGVSHSVANIGSFAVSKFNHAPHFVDDIFS